MKKYKHNYMISPMVNLTNLLLMVFPGIFIFILMVDPEKIVQSTGFLLMVVLFDVVFMIIHLIVSIFTKHMVFIDDNSITINHKKQASHSIKIDDVCTICFKLGGRHSPCELTLHKTNEKPTESVIIANPSLFMFLEIKKRCKNATFKLKNWKFYIFLLCLSIVAFLVAGLSVK